MKIAIVSQAYLPIHGGVSEHVHHTALELEKLGHKVTIITANFNNKDKQYNHPRVRRVGFDVTIPANRAFVNVTFGTHLAAQLKAIGKEKKFDIIHIHQPTNPVLPIVANRVFKCPKVGTFHTYMKNSMALSLFHKHIRKYIENLSGRIAVSPASKEFITRYYKGDYRIIPNGVDTERFSPKVKPIKKYKDGYFNILFVGRLDPRKGLKYLLQAMPIVLAAVPKARLIVVGGGALQEYYKSFVMNEIRDRIIFTGFVTAEELPCYYRTADVYVSPATGGESFGIVLIEAMASSTPVIASDIEGYSAVIKNGVDGILIPKEQPMKIAEKLIELLGNKNLRLKLGKKGRTTALQYSWPKVTAKIEKLYKEVLAKQPKTKKVKKRS